MGDVVALNTQALQEPVASDYLDLLRRAVKSARLSKSFPDRRRLAATMFGLSRACHRGLYDSIFLDSRSGLPNMASLTRVLADQGVAVDALPNMKGQAALDARRDEAEIYERQARKRPYYEYLAQSELAPVDEHCVLLRRHEPEHSRASFRIELTKLGGAGHYLRITIELTQTKGLWSHELVKLDAHGEVAHGTEALRGMVYRFATYDAETLFIRLHELDGVQVERVQRGVIGPILFRLPCGAAIAEPHDNVLTKAWRKQSASLAAGEPHLVAAFATDIAAIDVREERSNDPLSPLLSSGIQDKEQARYRDLRQRHPFSVFKDRKFVVTPQVRPIVENVCAAAGTKNLVYPLR